MHVGSLLPACLLCPHQAVAKYSALSDWHNSPPRAEDDLQMYLVKEKPHFADMRLLKSIARQTLQGLKHLHA